VTFISFVHSHILLCFFIIPSYCMHVRMPYVFIKELTYLRPNFGLSQKPKTRLESIFGLRRELN